MFLETICIKNGLPQNLDYHRMRMKATAQKFGFAAPGLPDFKTLIGKMPDTGKIRCSIVYRDKIESVTLIPYSPKKVGSLKLVHADIDYSSKFSDRAALNKLLEQKEDCDEILIVKNGFITDTSYTNVVFENRQGFFTPDTPLLEGTKRQKLLGNKIIIETAISLENLHTFDKVYLINAMLDIEDQEGIEISKIR